MDCARLICAVMKGLYMFGQLAAIGFPQVGPFAPHDADGDGFAGRHVLFDDPLHSFAYVTDGGSGDDDADDDEIDQPPTTGNATSDMLIRDYFARVQRQVSKINKREAGLRQARNKAERELADAKANGLILSADDKKAYDEFVALGVKPGDIKTKLTEHDTLTQENRTIKRDQTLRDVAAVAGASFDVLRDKAGDLTFDVRDTEVEQNGQKVKQKVVIVKDGATEKPLRDYATEKWPAYVPALFVGTAAQPGAQPGGAFVQSLPSQPAAASVSQGGSLLDQVAAKFAASGQPAPAAAGQQPAQSTAPKSVFG